MAATGAATGSGSAAAAAMTDMHEGCGCLAVLTSWRAHRRSRRSSPWPAVLSPRLRSMHGHPTPPHSAPPHPPPPKSLYSKQPFANNSHDRPNYHPVRPTEMGAAGPRRPPPRRDATRWRRDPLTGRAKPRGYSRFIPRGQCPRRRAPTSGRIVREGLARECGGPLATQCDAR